MLEKEKSFQHNDDHGKKKFFNFFFQLIKDFAFAFFFIVCFFFIYVNIKINIMQIKIDEC